MIQKSCLKRMFMMRFTPKRMSPQRNSTNPRGRRVEVHDAWPRRELGQTRHRNEISTYSSGATVDTVDQ